jgi:hypothetical protein
VQISQSHKSHGIATILCTFNRDCTCTKFCFRALFETPQTCNNLPISEAMYFYCSYEILHPKYAKVSPCSNIILPITILGPTQPPIQWVPGALSLGAKRPWCEADHLPPSSAEVKNVWSYTSTPQYVFMVWCSVKHRDKFTFYIFTFIIILLTVDAEFYWLTYNRDSSVRIAATFTGWTTGVRFPAGAGNFSLRHRVQTETWAHSASCPMGIEGSFPGGGG